MGNKHYYWTKDCLKGKLLCHLETHKVNPIGKCKSEILQFFLLTIFHGSRTCVVWTVPQSSIKWFLRSRFSWLPYCINWLSWILSVSAQQSSSIAIFSYSLSACTQYVIFVWYNIVFCLHASKGKLLHW